MFSRRESVVVRISMVNALRIQLQQRDGNTTHINLNSRFVYENELKLKLLVLAVVM